MGLCDDGRHLVMSDGGGSLFFRNPEDFQLFGQVEVFEGQSAVTDLNELELDDSTRWTLVSP